MFESVLNKNKKKILVETCEKRERRKRCMAEPDLCVQWRAGTTVAGWGGQFGWAITVEHNRQTTDRVASINVPDDWTFWVHQTGSIINRSHSVSCVQLLFRFVHRVYELSTVNGMGKNWNFVSYYHVWILYWLSTAANLSKKTLFLAASTKYDDPRSQEYHAGQK